MRLPVTWSPSLIHAQLLAQLVDEDAAGVGAADGGGEFPQRLAHESRLQTHLALTHLALDLGLGRQCGDTVDDDDVDGAAADELVGNLQCLLAVVGLADPQVVHVHAQRLGIKAVEGMLGVDDGGYTAHLLGLGDGVDGQGGLTRGFGTVDLDDASAGITAHTQCVVKADRAGGDDLDILDVVVAQLHDAA